MHGNAAAIHHYSEKMERSRRVHFEDGRQKYLAVVYLAVIQWSRQMAKDVRPLLQGKLDTQLKFYAKAVREGGG